MHLYTNHICKKLVAVIKEIYCAIRLIGKTSGGIAKINTVHGRVGIKDS